MNSVLDISKKLLENKSFSTAVDATLGTGRDSLFLSSRSKKVYAFDIQEVAIQRSLQLFKKENIENVIMIRDSHHNMKQYIKESIDVCLFNLGYLPGGNKELVTKPETTIMACKSALDLLNSGGSLHIICYQSHPGAKEEIRALSEYLYSLDQKEYNVFRCTHENGIHEPPFAFFISKR